MGRNSLKDSFVKIRDIGTMNPDRYKFVLVGYAGKSTIPVGYMEKINDADTS